VPLVGRFIDAFTDPLMGRISDQTRWRAGRRRPYFLIAALPFGLSFAAMWIDVPTTSQAVRFAYYAAVYCLTAVWMTVLAIPYLALLPEMAVGYDERTSLNTYRNIGSSIGVFIAIAIRPLAEALGGGARGYGLAGALVAVLLALPWPLIHRYSFERREFRERAVQTPWWAELRQVMRHRSFSLLTMAYLSGRIAMDLVSALMILYLTFWIGRAQDFEIVMGVFSWRRCWPCRCGSTSRAAATRRRCSSPARSGGCSAAGCSCSAAPSGRQGPQPRWQRSPASASPPST
jgi:Na+/melibiose symporter-like transporter